MLEGKVAEARVHPDRCLRVSSREDQRSNDCGDDAISSACHTPAPLLLMD
jgi:hypothetical protein